MNVDFAQLDQKEWLEHQVLQDSREFLGTMVHLEEMDKKENQALMDFKDCHKNRYVAESNQNNGVVPIRTTSIRFYLDNKSILPTKCVARIWKRGGYFERVRTVQTT